jgi:uncharacterized membrane protein
VSHRSGYIQEVDWSALLTIAEQKHLFVRMDVEIGRYLLAGDAVMSVWPAADLDAGTERQLSDAIVTGMERTPHQDLKLGVIELMDIAIKAMSPSVNDPTTALNAIDRLGEILLELAWRKRGDLVHLSDRGRPLVIARRPRLEDTIGLAFDQVRHFAAGNPTVAIALTRLLGRLAALSPESARAAFVEHMHEVKTSAELRIDDPVDRRRYDAAAGEAMSVAVGRSRPRIEAHGG